MNIIKKLIEYSIIRIWIPQLSCEGNDFWITFQKDIYNKENLSKLELNKRQIDGLIFFKDKREITSSEYAKMLNVAKRTAIYDLNELVQNKLLEKQGRAKLTKYVYL